ncbi:MAG: fasciclin domain-containing protein [Caldilinea sp.]
MKLAKLFPLLLVIVLLAAACAPAAAPAPAAPEAATEAATEAAVEAPAAAMPEMADIVDTAVSAGSFNTLVAAVEAAGLVDTLKGEGPFTVFAPTDEAFAALPAGTVEALLADPEGQLTQILLYHVVPGKVMSTDLSDGMTADTVQGSPVTFTIADGVVKVNDATVVTADIEASNGVIHVIDSIIMPPAEDAMASEAEAAAPVGNIAEVAAAAGNFTTLLAAVEAAGLVDELTSEGPFTVFAPTDEAFAALPAGTVDTLLADPEGALRDILLYHVVAGKVMSGDLSDGMTANTLQGAPVTISLADGAVKVNDSNVVAADVEASNGVIHVIDAVLLPPAQ